MNHLAEFAVRQASGLAIAVVLVAAVLLLSRTRRPILYTALAASIPGLLVNIFAHDYRTVGYHVWMHSAFTYQCMERLDALEDVLCAGMNVRYAWGHHLMVGWVCKALNVAPSIGVLVLDSLMMFGTVLLLGRTALLLGATKRAAAVAAAIGLSGCTIIHSGLLMYAVRFLSPQIGDARWVPYSKFFGFNNNQSGIFLFSLFLASGVALLIGQSRRWVAFIGLAAAQGLSGFCYPLSWLCMGAASAMMLAATALSQRTKATVQIALFIAASAIGTGSVLPFLLSINRGKTNPEASLTLDHSPKAILDHAISLAFALVVPIALAWLWRRKSQAAVGGWRWPGISGLVLCAAAAGVGAVYLLLIVPFACEYKFLALIFVSMSPLVGILVQWLLETRRLIGMGLMILMFHPLGLWVYHHGAKPWKVLEPCIERGVDLRAVDPALDRLQRWIAEKTPINSVIIDRGLNVPTLAHRSLYIALRDPRAEEIKPGVQVTQDGWLNTPDQMLYWLSGYERSFVEHRRALAEKLLQPAEGDDIQSSIRTIVTEVSGRPTFVICHDTTASSRLAAAGAMLAYSADGIFVHQLNPK